MCKASLEVWKLIFLRKKNINLSQLGPLGVHCFYLFLQYFDHHVQRLETHNWQQIWIQQQHIHVRKKKA